MANPYEQANTVQIAESNKIIGDKIRARMLADVRAEVKDGWLDLGPQSYREPLIIREAMARADRYARMHPELFTQAVARG